MAAREPFTASGDSYVIGVGGGLNCGEEIRVRWKEDGERTATLAVFEVPS